MPRCSPQLGILALVVLAVIGRNGITAGPPIKGPVPAEKAKSKPSPKKPATEEKPVVENRPSVVQLSDAKAPTAASIRQALETPVEVNFKKHPLNEVIKRLALDTKVNFWIDEHALTEEGVATDEWVTLQRKPLAAARVLDRILEPMDLTWIIQDDVVQITTIIAADEKFMTVTYPVGDLLDYARKHPGESIGRHANVKRNFVQFGDDNSGKSFIPYSRPPRDIYHYALPGDWLIDLLQSLTSGPWQNVDGTGGTISLTNHLLVVRQTFRNHEEVDGILRVIRQFTQSELKPNPKRISAPHYAEEEDAVVKKALQKVIDVTCRDVPLNSFLKDVAKTLDIVIKIDERALAEEGVALDEPVTLELDKIPAASALKIAFEPLGIIGLIHDGELVVTTTICAEERFDVLMHDICDLRQAKYTVSKLNDLLTQETSGPWRDIDGTGGWLDEPLHGMLVVRQTERVQMEIEAILADLRQQITEKPEKREPPDPQAVSTKFYAIDAGTEPKAVQRAILTLIEPKSWAKNGGDGEILIIGYQLVVKTRNEIHTQVTKFLTELGQSIQADNTGLGTSFPGGSGMFHQQTTPGQPQSGGGGFFSVRSRAIKRP